MSGRRVGEDFADYAFSCCEYRVDEICEDFIIGHPGEF